MCKILSTNLEVQLLCSLSGCPCLFSLYIERSNKSFVSGGSLLFKIQCLRTNSHVHVHCKPYNLSCQKLKIVAYSRNFSHERGACAALLPSCVVCLSSCRFSHESNHRPGVKAQIFLRSLPGGPLSLPFFPFSAHPLSLDDTLHRPGSTSPRRRAAHPPKRGGNRGGRSAAANSTGDRAPEA